MFPHTHSHSRRYLQDNHDTHTHGAVDPAILTTDRGILVLKWSLLGLLATALFQSVRFLLGRFLAFINRNQPNANNPGPRPLSYNERQLEAGVALPYVIWPNIDPFRASSLLDAVLAPGTANQVAQATPALRQARDFVRQARANGTGVFNQANPLRFEAFEVRYSGRRETPNRAVIDLSCNDSVILHPQNYFHIPNPEDRLFIPPAFVPLFVTRGWRLEGWF